MSAADTDDTTHRIAPLRERAEEQNWMFLGGTQTVYHCHHYNLFHDQTVDDALGDAGGLALRTAAAHGAFYRLLSGIFARLEVIQPEDRIRFAEDLFAWMGHGRVDMSLLPSGGSATSAHTHYGLSWKEKYGAQITRRHPADAVAAGMVAACNELAYDLPPGSLLAVESKCLATKAARCEFNVGPQKDGKLREGGVGRVALEGVDSPVCRGLHEEQIGAITAGLCDFLGNVGGDAYGLIPAFNIYATMHLVEYYNETAFHLVHETERRAPGAVSAAESLIREAGQVCVFNTFGNVLTSPEWEALVGPLSGDPEETVAHCLATARAFGFGRWTMAEFESNKRLVLQASSNYEGTYYRQRFGTSDKARCYFHQGATLALMVLAEKAKLTNKPSLSDEFYRDLFGGNIGWKVEQTQCQARGDAINEFVVERT